jgi:hypothetical protein
MELFSLVADIFYRLDEQLFGGACPLLVRHDLL